MNSVTRRVATVATTGALLLGGAVATASTASAAPAKGCYVTAGSAKIRSKPSTTSTTVGIAYKGNKCSEKDVVIKGSHFWYRVKMTSGTAAGKTGWIRADLLHTSAEDVGTCTPPC